MRAKTRPLPAKLSPPRLVQVLPRERLYAWLDDRCRHAAVWIGAPPGAGKTMLVASYCQERALRCLWYRLDAGDTDVGRFFAALGEAVDALGIRARRPLFAAEHVNLPRAYARAWFREVFAAVPRPLALVLDNLEQAALPALPDLLASAIDELPDGVVLLLTSRHAPPPELAAASLGGRLAVMPATALEFTPSESTEYARALGLDEFKVAKSALRVRGWAAGLRWLSHSDAEPADGSAHQRLFDYFAGLLHDAQSPPGQHVLLVSALLPWVPAALVAAVSGVGDAQQRLEQLCTNNLFTERVEHARGVYRLHPLLREYLLDRGRREFDPAQRRSLLRQAAQAFLDQRESDAALDLLLDADDVEAATELLLSLFEPKLALGHLDQLAAWVRRLPAALQDTEPRLRYGLARLCFLREDPAAVSHYEQSAQGFAARGDIEGAQLCAAGVLEWNYNTDNFIGHERWSAVLREPLPATLAAPCEPNALRLLNGQLLACFFDGDFEAGAALWVDTVLNLLEPGDAENEKLSVAITLLGCLERHKRWDDALLLAGRMEALLESERIGPRLKILARQQIAVDLYRQTGAYDSARRLALAARAQAHEHGFAVLEFEAVAVLLFASLYSGDEGETRTLLGELDRMVDAASVYHQRLAHQVHAWYELQYHRLAAAREHADALRAAIERSDMPARFRATWLQLPIYVRFAEGEQAAACAELATMCADAEAGSRQILEANLLSLQAWRHLHRGRHAAARAVLGRAWALASTRRYYQLLGPLRSVLAELAAFAIEHGVAPTFTAELIQRRRLRPPSAATSHWPWPLRIQTLGRFGITVDGKPLAFDGKLPRKPLALLKALIAFGADAVPEHRLTDALWPDDEADAAHAAFNVALHRLRKLLPQGAQQIRLQDGRLSLDRETCWVDCHAFEKWVAEADGSIDAQPGGLPQPLDRLRRAFALYQGHFLADEQGDAWSVSARERLRGKFGRVVVACGRALGDAGHDEEALACYQRGIEADDLNETFYQGVMRSALALHRPADGLAAYRRLERMLSFGLGVAPSPASQALRRSLLGQ